MKMSLLILSILLIAALISFAQDSKVVNKEFKVEGNCNQCKTRIEKAVKIDEVKYAKWNKSTKILKVAFENTITVDSLQRRIAEVGHDTEKFKAMNETYSKLPNCCLYRDNSKTH
jgi:cation transport ATPase